MSHGAIRCSSLRIIAFAEGVGDVIDAAYFLYSAGRTAMRPDMEDQHWAKDWLWPESFQTIRARALR